MKRLSAIWMFVLLFALMSGTAFAQAQYLIDGVNPLALNLVTVPPNDCQTVTITLDPGGEITTPLVSGGCWITWDTSHVSIANVVAITTPGGPWDIGATALVPEADGPGTYFVSLGLFATVPINQGPIPLCDVEFCSEGPGQSQITISTIPSFDTFVGDTTVWDPDIDDGIINLTVEEDTDGDGISDSNDNCPTVPNGPALGTCLYGTVGETCTSSQECDPNGFCSLNQEDRDKDGIGDVCDDATMCKGNFDYDKDVDGSDAALFKEHFGRSPFSDPCPPDGPAPVEKTWQTVCYDEDANPRDCAGTGEDGEHQRGIVWPVPRFTDHENGTATDNLTGLMWLKDTNCMVTHYPEFDNDATPGFGDVTWQLALDFVSGINVGNYPNCGAGYNDWRLPNPKELLSLIDFENFDPALPSGHPFHNFWFGFYWSSSSFAVHSREAWAVLLYTGRLTVPDKFVETCYVWPVRGGH